ncbi:unnamed protein product [Paramecium pentaurelia]|uniref:Transmembrane protein n=1 Tax=Paramecium pentaurelia TaxID=43138 RepID=A0A8S1S2I5_9CILI|nr:unnamed protein product [Paramecium pentaurelia]
MIFAICLCFLLTAQYQFPSTTLYLNNLSLRKIITINEAQLSEESCLTFGIWTKYNPLNIKAFKDQTGMFESNCFQLINVMEYTTQNLNFIYYVCLDYSQKSIVKTIQFVNDQDEQIKFEKNVDNYQYENIWYQFQLISWPILKRVEFIIIQSEITIFKEVLMNMKPFKEETLLFIFGESLEVQESKIRQIEKGKLFSLFPGSIVVYDPLIDIIPLQFDFEQEIIEGYYGLEQCNCENNEEVNLEDYDFNLLEEKNYISEHISCDFYSLGGWLRVSDIVQKSEEFFYSFIKMTAYIGEQTLLNENLGTFELIYQISPIETKIIVTAYSYDFPIFTKEILDGSQKIETEFQIQRNIITSWHYLLLELKDNELNIKITFYDQYLKNNQFYEAQVQVWQFHNCQYKIRYGNIQQDLQNYVNISVRNLQFINCQYDQRISRCHPNCLECDGPGNMHCLSCSAEDQRVYHAQFKQCICSYSTFEYKNKCVSYQDSNLSLKRRSQNTNLKCKAGYFEFEGDCVKCPSRVKNDLVTCFDCYSNVENWSLQSICQNDLYIPLSLEIATTLILNFPLQFLYDGFDLIICDYCFIYNNNQELQNEDSVYELYLHKSSNFKFFCSQLSEYNEDKRCTLCNVAYCLKCAIQLEGMVCLLCRENLVLVNGECKNQINNYIYQSCQPPYYTSYLKECKICPINKCQYCFEYFDEYRYMNTLEKGEKDFQVIDIDLIKIGCVLCEDGYIFNFNLGLCLKQASRIENCLTSYVLQLEEICIISQLNKFQVSLIINDCDNYIINCNICAQDYDKIVFCIECKIGFLLQNRQCYLSEEQGSSYPQDIRDLQVKAFLLVYNFDSYKAQNYNQTPLSNYCGKNCLKCNKYDEQYVCDECKLEYFEETIKIQYQFYCPLCPRLCQVCKSRSSVQLQAMNPLFLFTQENQKNFIYTQQCLLPIMDPFVFYDPYQKITKYCIDDNCDNEFQLETYEYSCFFNRFPTTLHYFNINSEYYNHIGMQTFTFNVYFEIYQNLCIMVPSFQSRATIKEEVFALNNAIINLISLNSVFFHFGNSILLYDYDTVNFIDFGFVYPIETQENFQLFNSHNQIDLNIINCTIQNSSITNIRSIFQADQFGQINIQNFSIINTTIKNSSFFNFQLFKFEGQMTIVSLYIYNCTIIDSQLFQFSQNLYDINIQNMTSDSNIFKNASIFTLYINYIEETTLFFKDLLIQRNQFDHSYFLFCSQIITIDISYVIFNFNQIENSIIFGFSYGLFAKYIQIKENQFIESQFLQTIEVTNDQNTLYFITELIVEKNVLQNVNLFHIFSNSYSNKLQISISQVQIQLNTKSITTDQTSSIFNINSKTLDINNCIISNNQEIRIFNLYDNEDIILSNLIFENQEMEQKVSVQKNCFQRINLQNQLILVMGFDKIKIEKCKIIKQSSVDESLIEIVSSKFKQSLGQIIIKNIEFYGNLIQQLNQVQSFSMLAILSENQIDFVMEDLKYQNNFMHVYTESTLQQSASLLYINSAPSTIYINNLNGIQNSMTNSSNSFIRITSKDLKLSNILIKNHNILPFNVWKDYYPINIMNVEDQKEINLFIMQIYHIKTIGGAAQFEVSKLECLNCTFQEILAAKSSVFDIVTQNEGILVIQNFQVDTTTNSLVEQTESSGCLSVNSQNSLLSLTISQAKFSNVINRMSTSIFSIIPSLLQNKIIIQDVSILNCISLKDQIVHIKFINQIVALNSILFINIKIKQDQQAWTSYFQIIGLIKLSEILELTGDENALIYLENCDFEIRDLVVEGMLIAPIIKLINVQNLIIFNCNINDIVSMISLDLIQISQIVFIKSLVYIKQLNIKSVKLFKLDTIPIVQPAQFQADYFIDGCSFMNNSFFAESPADFLHTNINQLQKSNYQRNSVISIMSQQNLSTILLEMITIDQNTFETTLNGIIYFDVAYFQKIIISNVICIKNIINEFGCLHFVGNNSVTSKIYIKDSNFIDNKGKKGVAIKITDISFDIKNCKIASNVASTQGGALYLKINSKIFRILKTLIINNHAQEGGGIYFEKDNNLNNKNFNNSFLLFNSAKIYGNNLVENPTHLTLYINSKEMASEKQVQNNTSTCILQIKPYTIIEQGIYLKTKKLMIPSNQEINVYQLFILQASLYLSYIKNMSLFFKNSKGEILFNLNSSTCHVSSFIVTNDGEEVKGSTYNHTLQYASATNNFELGKLAFSLNPYESNYSHLKIQALCKTQYSQQEFKYIINAQTFKCQLGEFYIENGCQICIWNQGFYSVTYNAIKCSIYDKQKFQSITSNMINLYEGYWRPNPLSDYTESCYKNPSFCLGGWEVGDSTCIQGHKGALCEMCDTYNERGDGKFFKDQQNFQCQSCSKNDNIILPLFFALFQALLSITLSLKSINKSNQLFASLKIFYKFSKLIFKLSQDHEGILLKLLLNYLWIFSVIFTFNINFSFSFIFIEQSSNSFYFMVNNLDCYLSDFQIELIYIKIFVILTLMLLQFNLILALSFLYHNITNKNMDNSLLSNTLIYLYVFNYGGLIKMLCSSLSVRQISNINYIQGDVSLLYDTSNHQLWIFFVILPLLLVFGCIIPFSLFLLTYIKRDILHKIKLRRHICYLFNEYNDSNYYWEQIKLLQKAIIILITTYFETNILLKTSLLGLSLLFYQAIAVKNKPYIISKFNNLDLQSGQICSITIFLAAIQYESQNINNQYFSLFLQIIIIILLVRLCYPFILNMFTIYSKKYSLFFVITIHSCLKYLKKNMQCDQVLYNYILREKERKERLKKNFQKLKEFLIPKSKISLQKYKAVTLKKRLRSTTNSGHYLVEVVNE